MSDILTELKRRLCTGLERASLKRCSDWAERYRVMGKPFPGPYSFKYHPWTREMHDSDTEVNVGMKAAQMGFTETALNITFYTLDIQKEDVLYVLPNTKPDAADFSSARFDPALELSEHLKDMFSDVMNVGHKRCGANNLYIRGSGSRTGLKSIPVSKIILDELEEMDEEAIPLAMERTSGQIEENVLVWMMSTPMIFEKGIDKYFKESTQDHFFFKCPSCNKQIELTYPNSICIIGDNEHDPRIEESYYKCSECGAKLEHALKHEWLAEGKWQHSYNNRLYRGWQIPQMYSSTISPSKFAVKHFKAQRDPSEEQEFFNSALGRPHEVKGARVTSSEVMNCLSNYKDSGYTPSGYLPTMGVDVGRFLHVTIGGWQFKDGNDDINSLGVPTLLHYTKLEHFEQLDLLMRQYGIKKCVIDANPERRKADEFAKRFPGLVLMCFYGNEVKGKTISYNEQADTITVDRTTWLDQSLGRFRNRTCYLPIAVNDEFKDNITAQVRVYQKDRHGNPVARYESTRPDHYGHAWTYNEIALAMAATHITNSNITRRIV